MVKHKQKDKRHPVHPVEVSMTDDRLGGSENDNAAGQAAKQLLRHETELNRGYPVAEPIPNEHKPKGN